MEDYKVIRAVGKGSFGKVYLVKHVSEGRQYVMKVIKLKGIPAKEREACRNEVLLMQRMQHPNIVAYKDSFFADGRDNLCIVMTYCDGGDLAGRLAAAKAQLFKEDQIMHWFVQVALAIHYMHENKVLHRDIKTQNIFLLGNGRLVLGDLGISKVLDGTMQFAKTQIGTPYYMSPELFKNMPYNHKSDVWALGCVLYELCTLVHPFEATSLQGLSAKIASGRYADINPKYSQSMRALIKSMLALDPRARPSVAEVLQQPYLKKHIYNFVKDIADRSALGLGVTPDAPVVMKAGAAIPISEGTMMFRAAAFKAAGSSAGGMDAMTKAIAAGLGPHANNLQQQLIALGLQPIVAKALEDAATESSGAGGSVAPGPMPFSSPFVPVAASAVAKVPSSATPIVTAGGLAAGARAGGVSSIAVAAVPLLPAGAGGVPVPGAAGRSVSPRAAKKVVKDSQAALEREEERKRAVEAALAKLREEKELRQKQRDELLRKQERMAARGPTSVPRAAAAVVPQAAPRMGGLGGMAAVPLAAPVLAPAPAAARPPLVRVPVGASTPSVGAASGVPAAPPGGSSAMRNRVAAPAAAVAPQSSGSGGRSVSNSSAGSASAASRASPSGGASQQAAALRERAAAIRKEAAAADAARRARYAGGIAAAGAPTSGSGSSGGVGSSGSGSAGGGGGMVGGLYARDAAAVRRAEADRKQIAELEQWERDRASRPHARAVSVAALQAASAAGTEPTTGAAHPARLPSPSAALAKAPSPAPAAVLSPSAAASAPRTPYAWEEPSNAGGAGLPPRAGSVATSGVAVRRDGGTPLFSPTAAARGPSPSASAAAHARSVSNSSAGGRGASPVASAEPPVLTTSVSEEAAVHTPSDAYLPANFALLSDREKVFARREAQRKADEDAQRMKLSAAAMDHAAERKRAIAQQREQYRGVAVAAASALPIHEAVLDEMSNAAPVALVTSPSSDALTRASAALPLPGARYATTSSAAGGRPASAGELPSQSSHQYLVGEAGAADAGYAHAGAMDGGEEGEEEEGDNYAAGELPDTDSEDSIILEAAKSEREAKWESTEAGPPGSVRAAAAGPRLALATAAEDDDDIQKAEAELREQLMRSTLRCNGLRASLEVARKVAVDMGLMPPAARHRPSTAAEPALPSVSETLTFVERPRVAPAAGIAASSALDERPIRPSLSATAFGSADVPLAAALPPATAASGSGGGSGSAAAQPADAPNTVATTAAASIGVSWSLPPPMYGVGGHAPFETVPEEEAEYDEDNDLGDEDGDMEGLVSFKNLPDSSMDDAGFGSQLGDPVPAAASAATPSTVGAWSTGRGDAASGAAFSGAGGVAHPSTSVPLSATLQTGSLSERVEKYRVYCVAGLGDATYHSMYHDLKGAMFGDTEEDMDDVRNRLRAALPAASQPYVDHLETLLNMEDSLL